MLFSIIIPVYNVEAYLQQCVNSVIEQGFQDLEVILIDDGSTDRSGLICDQYAKNYNNIIVYHKQNGGLSSARNLGINASRGEYLLFVDSDDWIANGCLSDFAAIVQRDHPDLIETVLIKAYPNEMMNTDIEFGEYLREEFTTQRAIDWILNRTEESWPAPKRVYSRKMIVEHNLRFLEGFLQEDMDWTVRVCRVAQRFSGYDKAWYYYRQKRNGSIMNTISAKYITDAIRMAKMHLMYFEKHSDALNEKLFMRLMNSVYYSIRCAKYCTTNDKEIVIRCMKENKQIFQYAKSFKHRLFSYMVRVFGAKFALHIISI